MIKNLFKTIEKNLKEKNSLNYVSFFDQKHAPNSKNHQKGIRGFSIDRSLSNLSENSNWRERNKKISEEVHKTMIEFCDCINYSEWMATYVVVVNENKMRTYTFRWSEFPSYLYGDYEQNCRTYWYELFIKDDIDWGVISQFFNFKKENIMKNASKIDLEKLKINKKISKDILDEEFLSSLALAKKLA